MKKSEQIEALQRENEALKKQIKQIKDRQVHELIRGFKINLESFNIRYCHEIDQERTFFKDESLKIRYNHKITFSVNS